MLQKAEERQELARRIKAEEDPEAARQALMKLSAKDPHVREHREVKSDGKVRIVLELLTSDEEEDKAVIDERKKDEEEAAKRQRIKDQRRAEKEKAARKKKEEEEEESDGALFLCCAVDTVADLTPSSHRRARQRTRQDSSQGEGYLQANRVGRS